MTRVAVLHWSTSSVGGINTTFQTLRAEALSRGDEFDILASDPQKTKAPGKFIQRKRVRGGDTFITIDGTAPHHPLNFKATLRFIQQNYDAVILSFLCPHPTKAYGDQPLFLPLLEGIKAAGIPIIGYVHDGYWDSYKEFGEMVLPLCDRTMVCQPAYGDPMIKAGYPVTNAFVPFRELAEHPEVERDPNLVIWLPQWKNIKGISKFWEGLPAASTNGWTVEMYGNGIEYYNMRLEPEWKERVGRDHFAPDYSGVGPAQFFGCVPETQVPTILSRGSFMIDFQGSGKPKYAAYRAGSYNHTIIEALYYGCVPVVHSSVKNTPIPSHLICALDTPETWADALLSYDRSSFNAEEARAYVLKNHSAAVLYDTILGR
jgi:hypothetical protein